MWKHLENLKQLKTFYLYQCGRADVNRLVKHLATLPKLRVLMFRGTDSLTDEGGQEIAKMTRLETLYIPRHSLTPDMIARIKASLPNIKKTNLWD